MIIKRQTSKPDSEKSMTVGYIGNKVKFKDMTEKQLKNVATYEEQMKKKHSTEKGKRDTRVRSALGAGSFAGIGGMVGGVAGKSMKSVSIGLISGLATWELLKIAADKNHKKNAELARKELERRGITDLGPQKSLEERDKEVLEDLKRKKKEMIIKRQTEKKNKSLLEYS